MIEVAVASGIPLEAVERLGVDDLWTMVDVLNKANSGR